MREGRAFEVWSLSLGGRPLKSVDKLYQISVAILCLLEAFSPWSVISVRCGSSCEVSQTRGEPMRENAEVCHSDEPYIQYFGIYIPHTYRLGSQQDIGSEPRTILWFGQVRRRRSGPNH